MSKTQHGYALKRYKCVFLNRKAVVFSKERYSLCRRYFSAFLFICIMLVLSQLSDKSASGISVRKTDEIMSVDSSFQDAESELDKVFDEFAKLLPRS